MSKLVVYYVDDQASKKEAKRYQERLSAQDFECKLKPPPELEELDGLLQPHPDLFLIDYELDRVQPDGTKVVYRGNTLSAEIRARLPDCPIVLITRKSIIERLDYRTRRQLTEHAEACDELIFKANIDDDLDKTRHRLTLLAKGFRYLSHIQNKNWESLAGTLEASKEETKSLREASPPLKQGQWIVTGAAEWIRNAVLKFPGILYAPIDAATRLGISIDSFRNKKVQEILAPAKYTGIFDPSEGRWWKGRLLRIAKELTMEEDVSGPVTRAFAEAFTKRFGVELSPAICVWDHMPGADRVCYILQKPVKVKHSLRYYPDNRPSVMDNARVSFRAIRESNDFYEDLLDAESLELLQEIERLGEP
jgi:hypothetical protein